MDLDASFTRCFDGLSAIGGGAATPRTGWNRFAWTEQDLAARAWFRTEAALLDLSVSDDRNGNLWAWWGAPGPAAVVTGSHLDTVPAGGAFDGALGLVSAFVAVAALRHRGTRPRRPLAVVAFADEEGARFNTPTFGSRLLTGGLDPATVLARRDGEGVTISEAVTRAGFDPHALGADPEALARIGVFVELHVEQGRGLADLEAPVALATGIWPHGRWCLELDGAANHAGTTGLADRRDPMLVAAAAVSAARAAARSNDAVATVGRLRVEPNSANAIASRVDAWLDARAPDAARLDQLVAAWERAVEDAAAEHGVGAAIECESRTAGAGFDPGLRDRMSAALRREGIATALLPTAAGHDAGVLSAHVPAGMLFVRNPTGVSHSPYERVETSDCVTGVRALAAVLEDLLCG
jgi:N-carbamoyl-L-amino-acid hydrolase